MTYGPVMAALADAPHPRDKIVMLDAFVGELHRRIMAVPDHIAPPEEKAKVAESAAGVQQYYREIRRQFLDEWADFGDLTTKSVMYNAFSPRALSFGRMTKDDVARWNEIIREFAASRGEAWREALRWIAYNSPIQ